jgi:predicted amidohydrolase YtcJ
MTLLSHASFLLRASTIHTQTKTTETYHAIAITGDRITAVSTDYHGLDACIGPQTRVIDEHESTILPSFDDTHTHLMFAAMSQFDVPVHLAQDIPTMLDMLRSRAANTPTGEWITTTANWQEYNLKEQRFPTLQELDGVSTAHPILVKRGGHNMVANSVVLKLAGIKTESESPEGGVIGRNNDGSLNGLLQDNALAPIFKISPHPTLQESVAGIEAASKSYAATGIGCVRDCAVFANQMKLLKAARDQDKLHVRMRVLIAALGMTSVAEVERLMDEIEQWRSLDSDKWLRVWGVKFGIDGGIEASATEDPYVARPDHGCCGPTDFCGALTWDPDVLVEAMGVVLRRGWRIGTHAVGDRAVRVLLDVYERLLLTYPELPPGSLVMEHGGLATAEQRARAVRLGIPVTVQHPLLHDAAGIQSEYLGKERECHIFPVRQWIDDGADVSAGSDYPVGAYGAMHSVWGLTTRQTVLGVMGPEHAISVKEAIDLHTKNAAKLTKEDEYRGCILPNFLADLTVWSHDPLTAQTKSLSALLPRYTIVGGKVVHEQEAQE